MRTLARYIPAALLCCSALLTSSAMAGPIPPEFTNWFVGLTLAQQDTFTVILRGDQTANIPVQNAFDGLTNPFYLFNPSHSTSVMYRWTAAATPTSCTQAPRSRPAIGPRTRTNCRTSV